MFFLPASTLFPFSFKTAATPTPEEGSMTSFILSHTSLVASMISSSVTHITSSTRSRMIGQVLCPMDTFTPSAMVTGGASFISFSPAFLDLKQSSAAVGSAATTRMEGLTCLAQTAMPPIMPPPPTGATIASKCGSSSKSSFAMVPCPAITSGSWLGWMSTPLVSSTTFDAAMSRACSVGSHSTTVAPYPFTAFFLTVGEVEGITIVASTPRTAAHAANACP
mmetsp:Transcript_10549/g.17093  ORF Transcript_10549/g.17093 Transcript_10549/m.17093 type:complete len:222 (-) Transcript_10549:527-1192(-)